MTVGCSKQDDVGAKPKSKHTSLLWANRTVGLCFTYLAPKKQSKKSRLTVLLRTGRAANEADPSCLTQEQQHWITGLGGFTVGGLFYFMHQKYMVHLLIYETPEISIGRSLTVERQFKLKGKSQFESILKMLETLFALESERLVQ